MGDTLGYTSFAGSRLIAMGPIEDVLRATKERLDEGEAEPILVFEDRTGEQIDFDLRGATGDVVARLATHPHFATAEEKAPRTGPGRPKLGVVSREVSLLPRHWQWLERQPGGISASMRRLVDDARKKGDGPERARAARDAASKFMWAMCGNLPGFEEASRALYAKDREKLAGIVHKWPKDLGAHVERLLARVWASEAELP